MALTREELTTEHHRAQEKHNQFAGYTEEKLNALEADLCNAKYKIEELEIQAMLWKIACLITGIGIIIGDIVKDSYAKGHQLHYAPGFNWQQWALLIFGFVLVFVGIYKKGKGK